MRTLPDHLRKGMKLVIVGCNPSESSVRVGHYYAGRGNEFWPMLYESGVVPEPFDYHDDKRVIEFGVGLTDLVKRPTKGIEELKRDKKTILMTTHYIEEAERLCDRVAIIDHGKVIALGTPRELKSRASGTTRIELRLSKPVANGKLKSLEGVADAREVDGAFVLHSQRPPQTIVSLVKHLEAEGNELVSLEIATPSLEDVFIEMTGRRLRD